MLSDRRSAKRELRHRADEILLNAVRHSFLATAEKQRLEVEYRAELESLKAVHLEPSSSR